MREEEIIRCVQEGNQDMFAELVDLYKKRIFAIAYKFTNDYNETQDLAQEIFLKIYRQLGSFRRESKFSTWTYRVATNACLDWKKKNRAEIVNIDSIPQENPAGDINGNYDQSEPESALLAKEEQQQIHEIIYSMPDIYKTVISMYHFQQMTYKEIAQTLDLSQKTVETRLYRARRLLRDDINKLKTGGGFEWHVKKS